MARNSITKFENSLTEFLIEALADKYGDAKSYAYRYNNLKVFMDPKSTATPHFYVSIGISEACFAIADGKKLDGGLGVEDGYVKRWAGRINIQKELENHWKILKEAIAAEQEDENTKKSLAQLRLKRAETSDEDLKVDMTGTGITRKNNELRTKRENERRIINQENEQKNSQKTED
jgi:hypothetical protein